MMCEEERLSIEQKIIEYDKIINNNLSYIHRLESIAARLIEDNKQYQRIIDGYEEILKMGE